MSALQSNTQEGLVVKTSAIAFLGKEAYFAALNSDGNAVLPTSAGQLAQFVVDDEGGGVSGDDVTLRPLHPNRNVRVVAASSIAAAEEVTTDATGKACGASTTNWVVGIAEEAIVQNQLGLIRPLLYKKA